MEYPVCLDGQRAGTLYLWMEGEEFVLRAVCRGAARGLYRLYLQGSGGEVLLGVTEDGCLRRRFSAGLLHPAGEVRCGVLRRCGEGEKSAGRDFLRRLPPEAQTVWHGGCAQVTLPYGEGAPFPLEELFCFAQTEPGRIIYRFDGAGSPIMPK